MRVQLRVVRASVWLSSHRRHHRDGSFLALIKTRGKAYHVLSGSLDVGDVAAVTRGKRWAMAPIKFSDTTTASGARRAIEVEMTADDGITAVEIGLFVVSSNQEKKQRIAWVARAALQLHRPDLTAVDSAHEIIFKSPLEDEVGSIEIALQRVDHTAIQTLLNETEEGGAFSVQWTSSAALERDLAAKEHVRVQAETRLIERLLAVEATAERTAMLRAEALTLVRRKHAALVIQSAYRALRRRRRETKRQQRREQHEIVQARKAVVRAKVLERNQHRSQRLREQWTTRDDQADQTPVGTTSFEWAEWMETQREATRTKLDATLARLESERDEKLRAIGYGSSRQRNKEPSESLSDELVHAIQRLHLRK